MTSVRHQVLHLRVSISRDRARALQRSLAEVDGIRRLVASDAAEAGTVVISGDVEPVAADEVAEMLMGHRLSHHDFLLSRVDVVAPIPARRERATEAQGFAWVEVLGEARVNSRPLGRYLALMAVAAVIAALGVIASNGILIVGAMAVSPDLLPVCAACVGIVGRRGRLTARSLGTLLIGLTLIGVVALTLTALLVALGFVDESTPIGGGGLRTLAEADYSTVVIALAAGVAAMLSFETRASAAVGVAISVTTIPASTYAGVAVALGESSKATGALVVLAINVSLLLLSGALTLALQTWISRRRDWGA